MEQCRLCHEIKETSLEHYIPAWLQAAGQFRDEDVMASVGVEENGAPKILWDRSQGPFRAQRTRGLVCRNCNTALGGSIERLAMEIISPLCSPRLPENAESLVRNLNPRQGTCLAEWCALRAWEQNIVLNRDSLHESTSIEFAARFGKRARGEEDIRYWDETVEISFATIPGIYAFFLAPTFIDANLNSVRGPRSFQWGMQVNELILLYRYLPKTEQTRVFGRPGLCVYPRRMPDENGIRHETVPRFPTIEHVMRLPVIKR